MVDIVFMQLGIIRRARNNFVEIVTVAKRYFIIAHVRNKESKKQLFRIRFPVKLANRRMLIKKRKICSYVNCNITSLGKMAEKVEPFSY